MNRTDLLALADLRVADAEVLLAAGRWAAAYYLVGYAAECALKAIVASQFHEHEVPERTVVNQFYTHRLDQLLAISGAKPALEERAATDARFQEFWTTVRDWSEYSRYDPTIVEARAREMFAAVCDPLSGVLPWMKTQC